MNTPAAIAENYLAVGKAKVSLSPGRMFLLAVMAGIYIALAGVGASVVSVSIEQASVAKLAGACLFPAGLTFVLLAGSELFTGNCLLVLPLLQKEIRPLAMVRSWVIVYAGNFFGSLLIAWAVTAGHTFSLFDNGLAVSAIQTAAAKCSLSFSDAFLRGVLCNLLVCLAVWISFAARDVIGKIAGLYFPILLFVLCGYEHCVANMYYIPAGLFALADADYAQAAAMACVDTAALQWGNFLLCHLLPVTLGNMVGGTALGAVYWCVYLRKDRRADCR